MTDALTGLGNRRAYDAYLEGAWKSSAFPLTVISADGDDLEHVNETYGHLVGDEYIRMTAVAIQAALPEGAKAFRIDGDKFAAFVPGADAEAAEKIIDAISSNEQLFQLERGEMTVSLGSSIVGGPFENLAEAIQRADQVMYVNKAAHK